MDKMTLFTNWTEETFTWNWDGKPWTFKTGEQKWLNNHLARHFAKHLANREIMNSDKPTNSPLWKEYFQKCLSESIEAESPERLESAVMERRMEGTTQSETGEPKTEESPKRFCDVCDSKGGRHKKTCPINNVQSSTDEESFAGLKK